MMKKETLKRTKKRTVRNLLQFMTNLLLMVTIGLFIVNYAAYYVKEDGYSMEPMIKRGSSVLISKIWYQVVDPERFEIVAYMGNENTVQIKRIVGLPGEEVQIKDQKLYINGQLMQGDAYLDDIEIAGRASKPVKLGADEYFVLGDNSQRSQDSRFENTGNIKREQLLGRAWFYLKSILDFKIF